MATSELLNFADSVQVARLSRVVVSRVAGRAFSAVRLNSHTESFRQFDEVFQDEDLRPLVKTIEFDVVLPIVSGKRLKKYQSTGEASANTTAFSNAIFELFRRLSRWAAHPSSSGIRLKLTATSPSDDPDKRTEYIKTLDCRNAFEYITINKNSLSSPADIPVVPCVTSLDWDKFDRRTGHCSQRLLHTEAIYAIISVLPCLGKTTWHVTMPPRRLGSLRKEVRSALARALTIPEFSMLKSLTIHLRDRQPFNERVELEMFAEPGEEDDLNRGVRRVCGLPTLTNLELRGSWILSAEAFTGAKLSCSLQSLLVDIAATAPDGRWHLDEMAPEDQDSEPSEPDSDYYADYGIEPVPKELPPIDSGDSDLEDPELPERAEDIANMDWPNIQIRGVPGTETLTPLLSSFAEIVDKANSAPDSSLRVAEMHLCANLLLAQVSIGYIAAGVVDREAFLSWPRPARVRMRGEELDQPNWYWDAVGPYGPWEIPSEIRRFMCGGELHIDRHERVHEPWESIG